VAALKWVLFTLGTLAFFAAVLLAVKHPGLVESPGQNKADVAHHPLRRWDKAIAWVMWAGWGCAALLTYIDRVTGPDAGG